MHMSPLCISTGGLKWCTFAFHLIKKHFNYKYYNNNPISWFGKQDLSMWRLEYMIVSLSFSFISAILNTLQGANPFKNNNRLQKEKKKKKRKRKNAKKLHQNLNSWTELSKLYWRCTKRKKKEMVNDRKIPESFLSGVDPNCYVTQHCHPLLYW